MKTKTVEAALKKSLISKFWKNIWHREIGNEILALYNDYKNKDLSSLLEVMSREANIPYHPFDATTYTENIVLSNEILVFGPDTIGKAYLKRNILLSNSLVYIGFFDAHQKEISKFYFNNNLKYTINKTEGGGNDKYKVQAYINDSSTVFIDVQEGNIKEAILMIKGSTYGQENRIVLNNFYDNSNVVSGDFWKPLIEHFRNKEGVLGKNYTSFNVT